MNVHSRGWRQSRWGTIYSKLCKFFTHFSLVSHFYTPWKRQKTKCFLTFSRRYSNVTLDKNGLSSWKMVKNTAKVWRRFFFSKINKNMQRKPGLKHFLYWRVWRHLRHIQNFVTSLLPENWSKHSKTLYTALFLWSYEITSKN